MATDVHYRQCRLQKKVGEATLEQVSHIPEPYCKVGNVLELQMQNGRWSNGWTVLAAGGRCPATEVDLRSRDHLKMRKASDC